MSHNFTSPSYQQPLTSSGALTSIPKSHKEGSADRPSTTKFPAALSCVGSLASVSATSCSLVPFPVKAMVTAVVTAAATKVCLALSFPAEPFIPCFIIIFLNPDRKCCLAPTFLNDFMFFALCSPVSALETCWVLRGAKWDTLHLPVDPCRLRVPWGE